MKDLSLDDFPLKTFDKVRYADTVVVHIDNHTGRGSHLADQARQTLASWLLSAMDE